MQKDTYSLQSYVEDLRKIASQTNDDRKITEQLRPLAKKLASQPIWDSPDYRETNLEQGFGVHLLHEEDDHSLAVFMLAWAPGRGTHPHNHKTWAVVAGVDGVEHEINFNRLDDGSKQGYAKLEKSGEQTLHAGDVGVCLPDDIHTVKNTGTEVSLSLHTYGIHLNHTGRMEFDVESCTERPFIVSVT